MSYFCAMSAPNGSVLPSSPCASPCLAIGLITPSLSSLPLLWAKATSPLVMSVCIVSYDNCHAPTWMKPGQIALTLTFCPAASYAAV